MNIVATVMGALVAALGVIGVVYPDGLLAVARELSTERGIYVAAALRIVFGWSLLLSAAGSRAPRALRVLGAFVLVAGLVTPAFGSGRAIQLVRTASQLDELWLRFIAVLPIAVGLSAVWALSPKAGPPRQ
jgi:uncharacterized membrane protein